jgi:hypothetical protein
VRAARPIAPSQTGQASVELAALLPLLAVVLASCWQIVLVAETAWSAQSAARAAARAAAVGADPLRAARRALPPSFDHRVRLRRGAEHAVELRLRVPAVIPDVSLGSITAHGHFASQG